MKKFGVDKNGFIVTEVSTSKVKPIFRPVVKYVLDTIIKQFDSQLDGVYLYGSVATGKAIKGKSDLDILLVFKHGPSKAITDNINKLEKLLSKKYSTLLRGVGLATTSVQEIMSPKEKYGFLCYIKHLCVCIHGNDLTKKVSKYKPTKAVAKGFNGDIAKKLGSSKAKLQKSTKKQEIANQSQEIGKKIIRSGFSLVMPRAKSWTTNLQKSVDTFIHYYPDKAEDMIKVLEWTKGGHSHKKAVINSIETFGKWLSKEFESKILK